MSKSNNQSLILKERDEIDAAPFLFSDENLPQIDKTKPKFHCTGDYLFKNRRDVYDGVVLLLAEPGVTIRSICRDLHVSDDTVRAVRDREAVSLAAQKKTVISNIAYGLRLASERVIEVMPEASAKDALLGVGILVDKLQLLDGLPTAIIAAGPFPENIFDSWNEYVEKQLRPGIDVLEIASETHSEAGKEKTNSADGVRCPALLSDGRIEGRQDYDDSKLTALADNSATPTSVGPSTGLSEAAALEEAGV